MLRLTKLTDYAIVILTHFVHGAGWSGEGVLTARDLSQSTHLPLPTVSKVLKSLARAGLLASQRGVSGGYSLARPPGGINIADVIAAIEGPISLTECGAPLEDVCAHETGCPCRTSWRRINDAVVGALEKLTIVDMARDEGPQRRPADVLVTLGARRIE